MTALVIFEMENTYQDYFVWMNSTDIFVAIYEDLLDHIYKKDMDAIISC